MAGVSILVTVSVVLVIVNNIQLKKLMLFTVTIVKSGRGENIKSINLLDKLVWSSCFDDFKCSGMTRIEWLASVKVTSALSILTKQPVLLLFSINSDCSYCRPTQAQQTL